MVSGRGQENRHILFGLTIYFYLGGVLGWVTIGVGYYWYFYGKYEVGCLSVGMGVFSVLSFFTKQSLGFIIFIGSLSNEMEELWLDEILYRGFPHLNTLVRALRCFDDLSKHMQHYHITNKDFVGQYTCKPKSIMITAAFVLRVYAVSFLELLNRVTYHAAAAFPFYHDTIQPSNLHTTITQLSPLP